MDCSFKVGIIGTGNVGMATAFACLTQGAVTDLVLVGRDLQKARGEQLDLEHALPFLPPARVQVTDNYADVNGCDVIIFTAGAAQLPGESRLDLTAKNLRIIDEVLPQVFHHASEAVVVMVTNPVDVLTFRAIQIGRESGVRDGQVFGSGTLLDTARLRFHLSEMIGVHPRSIHAYILGEHGESAFPIFSTAQVGGQSIYGLPQMTQEMLQQAFEETRTAAGKIIQAKGSTAYAIAAALTKLLGTIRNDVRSILPVSTLMYDYYGEADVCLSVPCVIGRSGVIQRLAPELSVSEQAALHKSAQVLREARKAL